jgi:hypothetical protein
MDASSTPPHHEKRERFAGIRSSLQGAHALLLEYPKVFHVCVQEISDDDWGVNIRLSDSLLPGMHRLPRSPLTIGAAWEIFSLTNAEWQAHYIPWRLSFDAKLICASLALGAAAIKEGRLIEWRDFTRAAAEHQSRKA